MSWESYERSAERGPLALAFKVGCAIICFVFIISLILIPLHFIVSYFNSAAEVTQEEAGPRALLRKYEWFKETAAQLDKKDADIRLYQARQDSVKDTYGKDAAKWPRDVRESYSQDQAELLGVKSSYNTLAAEYNANMSKINYRFTNVGSLPKGADKPLPREYREYRID